MRDEQGGQGDSSVAAIKARSRSYVVFISSVQAFDKLFKNSELCRLGIEILKSDNLAVLQRWRVRGLSIDEVNPSLIRGIAIGDKSDALIGFSSTDGLIHSTDCRLGASVVGDMAGSDFKVIGRDEKEGVVMLALHLDVGFITVSNGSTLQFL